jgi:hypothetical protein
VEVGFVEMLGLVTTLAVYLLIWEICSVSAMLAV